ncbi:MAG TPA: hypothetical protein DCL64_06730, partial [Ruminococcaceae bacterium]|nr:hypothetical protein [Oscillospiraceae bacterium]
ADIVRVNVGFMAVKVPKGASSIRFNYQTPGIRLGAVVTLGGFLLLAFYWFMTRRRPRRQTKFRVKSRTGPSGEGRPNGGN